MGTAEAIQARRDCCVDPEIPETLSETFARSIPWIEEIWKLEKSERSKSKLELQSAFIQKINFGR